jgi:hypothetical protein
MTVRINRIRFIFDLIEISSFELQVAAKRRIAEFSSSAIHTFNTVCFILATGSVCDLLMSDTHSADTIGSFAFWNFELSR